MNNLALTGTENADILSGADGDDTLTGLGGNDVLTGGIGANLISAGDGDDTITALSAARDNIDGGAGHDLVVLVAAAVPGFINNSANPETSISILTAGASATHTLTGVEAIDIVTETGTVLARQRLGSEGADSFTFSDASAPVTLWGGLGDDDFVLTTGLSGRVEGGDGNDRVRIINAEIIYPSTSLDDPQGALFLLHNGAALDLRGVERFEVVNLNLVPLRLLLSGTTGDDLIDARSDSGIIEIMAGWGNDTVFGSSGDDLINLWRGNDWVDAGAGNDTIGVRADGNSTVMGGLGEDRLRVDGPLTSAAFTAVVTEDVQGTLLTIDATHTVRLDSVETIDVVTFVGGIAGNGNDLYDARGVAAGLFVSAAGGNDTLLGGRAADTLYGGAGDDRVEGGAGNDEIDISTGADTLTGGLGADFFYLSTLGGAVTSRITDFAFGDTLVLGSLIGQPPSGLVFIGDAAFTGALGQVQAQLLQDRISVRVDLDGDGFSDGGVDLLGADIVLRERVVPFQTGLFGRADLRGTEAGEGLIGSAFSDLIFGAGGDDLIDAGSGDDVLQGGAGADTLQGGVGFDAVDYSERTTGVQVTFDAALGGFIGGPDGDRATEIESIIGSAGNDTLGAIGTTAIQLIGGAGADRLNGGAGADLLIGDFA